MFLPIRTDRRLRHTPWVNYGLIAVNVVIFLVSNQQSEQTLAPYLLNPLEPRLLQFLTYQFLHAGWMHLLGNMLFLHVFGNSVEDRLGKLSYLAFYLAGGVLAGVGHALVESAPVIGASGAVAAVSGAYLALFPKTKVTIIYFMFFIGVLEISSMVVILFYFGYNVFQAVTQIGGSGGGVAYLAHLSGYVYGFIIGMGLLWSRLLSREPYDLMSLLEHRRRRAQFKTLSKEGYRPWEHNRPGAPPKAGDAEPQPVSDEQKRQMELRAQISAHLSAQRTAEAADTYAQLLKLDAGQVMARQQQIDLGNYLMSQGRHELAAQTYELFLNTYKTEIGREQIELILGLTCVRYLNRRQRGRELLTAALRRLKDRDQIDLAQQMLAEIDQ
jgi:membrane associated rhomboid family serine protease